MWYFVIFALMTILVITDTLVLYWIAGITLGFIILSLRKRILLLEERLSLLLGEEKSPIIYKTETAEIIEMPKISILSPSNIESKEKVQTPSFVSNVFQWLTDGNLFVRLGLVILFIGFSMLFKEAYERGFIGEYFPIELRLVSVLFFAIALFYFGFKTVKKRRNYGLLLQGGAIGIIYLTVYSSLHLYGLISALFSFGIFSLLSALTIIMALRFNAQSLAIFALIGGFISPILSSTGTNNYIGLFTFYALLNISIFYVSTLKSWRMLNLTGFVFTFVIASAWGFGGGYTPAFFASTEPFLIFFFLLYIAISIYFAKLQDIAFKNYLDSTLLFALPIIAFILQSAMVKDFQYGLAISTFVLGFFYLLLSFSLSKIFEDKMPLLREVFLVLGLIFITLSVPFAFDGILSSITWILEGAGMVWIAFKQHQKYRRFLGLSIQVFGIILLFNEFFNSNIPLYLYFDKFFLSALIVMFTLIFTAYMLSQNSDVLLKKEKKLASFYMIYSYSLVLFILAIKGLGVLLLTTTLLSLLFAFMSFRVSWKSLYTLSVILIPVMLVITIFEIWLEDGHLFILGGFESIFKNMLIENGILLWLFAFASLLYILYQWQNISFQHPYIHNIILNTSLLFVFIASWETIWHSQDLLKSHPVLFIASMPLVALLFMTMIFYSRCWFFIAYKTILYSYTSLYISVWLMIWLLLSIGYDGGNIFVVWLPLLNPLELIQIITMWILYKVIKIFPKRKQHQMFKIFVAFLFIWVNIMILRTLSHWLNIPWDFDLLFAHLYTHTTISIFWTLLGLILTFIATRKHLRVLWIVGASLLGFVVVKLFLIDLQDQDKIFATISFIVVGILLLVAGYISPLPPQKEKKEEKILKS